jgi:acyl-CoA thioester hydrolase
VADRPEWDLPDPFVIEVLASPDTIDSYGHVNNTVYIGWLEACAWAHSEAVGIPESRCLEIQRGMAVRNLNVDYLAACYEGDRILVADWLVANDGRLRATRRFQLINATRGQVAMRAEVLYVCMNLATGRPVRMPVEFLEAYQAVEAGEPG